MLNALKQQLVRMSNEEKSQFLKNVQKKAGKKLAAQHSDDLRNFILVMPEMLAQVRVWAEDDRLPVELRKLQGYVLTYLYHPVDFLHDEGYGFFGYLDDAYVVGMSYRAVLKHSPTRQLNFLPNQSDLADQLDGWLSIVKKVIPKQTIQIDKMLNDLLSGKQDAFQKVIARNSKAARAGI